MATANPSTKGDIVRSFPGQSRRYKRTVLAALLAIALGLGATWVAWKSYWLPSYLPAGRAAIAAKDWPRAQRHLQKYIAWHSGETEAHFLMAQVLAEQGNLNRSLSQLNQIPDSSPLVASARWHEASLLLQLNRAAQAERAARRSLELEPNSLDARQLLSLICRWENRLHEAERLLAELYELCAPEHRANALVQLFELHVGQFDVKETQQRLEAFLANDPSDFSARLALARLHVGMGDNAKAGEMLDECWRLKPGDIDVRAALVNCYVIFGDYQKATRLLETWPADQRDARYWESMGTYQSEYLQHYEQAAESYRRVLQHVPDDWRVRHRLAICLRSLGDEEGARVELERVDRARVALQREKMEETLKALPDMITTADGRYQIGRIYEEVGRVREATLWYGEALALDPEHDPSREGRARLSPPGS